MADPEVVKRELAYHEKLYSGFAQRHFARPAVRLLRCHMVARILHLTGVGNVRFEEGSEAEGRFDLAMGIFFLHHLPDDDLAELPRQVERHLAPGGMFYSLDPSRRRLSGALGRLLVPWMMRRYQTPDERELEPEA